LVAQIVLMVAFIAIGAVGAKRFHPAILLHS
jgi:hypothetical protein